MGYIYPPKNEKTYLGDPRDNFGVSFDGYCLQFDAPDRDITDTGYVQLYLESFPDLLDYVASIINRDLVKDTLTEAATLLRTCR